MHQFFFQSVLSRNPNKDQSYGPFYKGSGKPGDCHDVGESYQKKNDQKITGQLDSI